MANVMFSFANIEKVNEFNNVINRHTAGDDSEEEEEEEEEEEVDEDYSSVEIPVAPSSSVLVSRPVATKNVEPSFKYLESDKEDLTLEKKNEKNIAFLIELANQFNRKTITDVIQLEIQLKMFNVTFAIFTFFYLIVKTFGETQYILINIGVYLIIWLLISSILIEELLFVANDFHSGWNYYLKFGNSIITQLLFLITAALIYEEVRGNSSIHPADSVFFFVIYLIQWMTFVFYLLILVHFTEQFWFFIQFIINKKPS